MFVFEGMYGTSIFVSFCSFVVLDEVKQTIRSRKVVLCRTKLRILLQFYFMTMRRCR
jgi:hypothetical protein